MAFFKIRWPGQQAAEGKPAKVARAVRGETVEVMRRRARHRLIGAALLVLVGVVGFPLVFDTQPRPIPIDTRIEIPDRDKVAPLVVPAPSASVDAPAAAESVVKREPEPKVAVLPQEKAPAPAAAVVPHKEPSPAAFVEARPQPLHTKPEASTSTPPTVASLSEAERARALLEGRSGKTPAAASPAPVAAGGERFIVQVGAFSEESKVREARQKLERAGLTTYTQVVETKDGKRTRVRVGPFQGRAEAEKASAKIKGLGLPASILSL
ncbi:MAG: SPOR domain-containing protein [Simplicispira sp.]|nr:SPOR domain-containing protein [Simplicispira sp.]